MRPVAAPTEKVRLVCLATGEVHEAWPIDAKEHLKAGDYVREADYDVYLAQQAEKAAAEQVEAEKAKAAAAALQSTLEATADVPDEAPVDDAPKSRRK